MKPITNIREFIESVTVRGSEHYITRENVDRVVEYYESKDWSKELTNAELLNEIIVRGIDNTKDVIKD